MWQIILPICALYVALCLGGCSSTPQSQPNSTCGFFSFAGRTDKDQHGNVASQFDLSFTFHPAACNISCDCGKVWFVQILRVFDPGDATTYMEPTSQQANRMVSGGDPTVNGWAIDRRDGEQVGYYNLDKNFNVENATQQDSFCYLDGLQQSWCFGRADSAATMHDSLQPGSKWGHHKNLQYQGITAAVCIDGGNCQAQVLGMKEWIINYNKDSNTIDTPMAFDTFQWAQNALTAAAAAWNKQGGHDPLPVFTFGP